MIARVVTELILLVRKIKSIWKNLILILLWAFKKVPKIIETCFTRVKCFRVLIWFLQVVKIKMKHVSVSGTRKNDCIYLFAFLHIMENGRCSRRHYIYTKLNIYISSVKFVNFHFSSKYYYTNKKSKKYFLVLIAYFMCLLFFINSGSVLNFELSHFYGCIILVYCLLV